MNTVFYSKEAIMQSFEISMPATDIYDIDLASQLFIARYERRIAWDWHFIMGVLLFSITIPRFIIFLFIKNKTKKRVILNSFYFILLSIMIITGLILHMGIWIDIDYDFRESARAIHHYNYYALLVFIFIHLSNIVYISIKTKKDIIGKMIHGRTL